MIPASRWARGDRFPYNVARGLRLHHRAASHRYLVVEVDAEDVGGVRADSGPDPKYDKFQVAAGESYFVEGFSSRSPPMGPRVPCGSVRR